MRTKALSLLVFLPFLGSFQSTASAQTTSTITGTVTDSESGDPLSQAQISIDSGRGAVRRAVTDAQGRYRITVKPGTYTLEASAVGHRTWMTIVSVTAGGTATANYSLVPSPAAVEGVSSSKAIVATIIGTVIDAAGHAVAGVIVRVQPDNPTASAHTNGDGVYVITGLPAGKYNVTTVKEGFKGRSAHATVKAGETTRINFTLQKLKARS